MLTGQLWLDEWSDQVGNKQQFQDPLLIEGTVIKES